MLISELLVNYAQYKFISHDRAGLYTEIPVGNTDYPLNLAVQRHSQLSSRHRQCSPGKEYNRTLLVNASITANCQWCGTLLAVAFEVERVNCRLGNPASTNENSPRPLESL